MVTKWKKSSINTVIVYVMGVSFLMAGTLGILNVSSSAGGILAVIVVMSMKAGTMRLSIKKERKRNR